MAKKTTTKNTISKPLSGVEGTVAFVLNHSMIDINSAYADTTVTLIDFKQMVISMVSAAKSTKGQQRIISNIQKKPTKDKVIEYVYNSLLCGDGLAII